MIFDCLPIVCRSGKAGKAGSSSGGAQAGSSSGGAQAGSSSMVEAVQPGADSEEARTKRWKDKKRKQIMGGPKSASGITKKPRDEATTLRMHMRDIITKDKEEEKRIGALRAQEQATPDDIKKHEELKEKLVANRRIITELHGQTKVPVHLLHLMPVPSVTPDVPHP